MREGVHGWMAGLLMNCSMKYLDYKIRSPLNFERSR